MSVTLKNIHECQVSTGESAQCIIIKEIQVKPEQDTTIC